ncbi:MAG: transglutaminase domain-containing protein [candidate division NC10 bacterium]|nr:transglutaminase domain-containing protein [candidate division NC10 bacterium]
MTTPPFLVGAALLFWGWQTGLVLPALFVALVLEASRVFTWRLELSRTDFNRISDLCALLLLGSAVWVFALGGTPRTVGGPRAVTILFQRIPMLVALLVACQVYSTVGRIPLGALLWTLRKKAEREGVLGGTVDLAYPYVALCVLSASAANVRTPAFYAGLSVLAAWALWRARSPRFSPLWWAPLLGVAVVLGYGGQVALHRLQERFEQVAFEYLFNLLKRRDTDPFRSSTAIGHLGQLKLSDRILLRVEPDAASRMPILLREASYNVYNLEAWFAVGAPFSVVHAEADGETWKFAGGRRAAATIAGSAYLHRGRGVLALPNGTSEVEKLAVVGVSRNPLGAVKVDEGLGLVNYRARFGPESVLDAPPNASDLGVPTREGPVLVRIAAELGLAAKTPAERVGAVRAFFRQNFRYSLYQRGRPVGATPLEDFLLRRRSGHCEYFATATVLLLRAAGVPARYGVGYSVQEWSALERRWVVRARHAHSWTLARPGRGRSRGLPRLVARPAARAPRVAPLPARARRRRGRERGTRRAAAAASRRGLGVLPDRARARALRARAPTV